jgi:hypothetical protein
MHQPVVSLIAVGPDETVPHGIPWESVHLPSFATDEVTTWIAEHDTAGVFIMPGMEMASKGTAALPVTVSQEEYLMLTAAIH